MFDKATREWIRRTGAVVYRTGKSVFAIAKQYDVPDVKKFLHSFDAMLERSIILKDSPTTTAGLAAFSPDGRPVFLKRTNNKGLRFTVRYLFRPARSFRSARSATDFEALGLRTPAVIAAGEKRTGMILNAGYLVTASCDSIRGMEKILTETEDPPSVLDFFFHYAGPAMAKIHKAGLLHGDLKIGNFYCEGIWSPDEAKYGIWDLDSVRRYPKGVPQKKAERELGRLISSSLMLLDADPRTPDSFFDPEHLAARLVELYELEPGISVHPDPHSVADFARERWNKMEKRRRKDVLEK